MKKFVLMMTILSSGMSVQANRAVTLPRLAHLAEDIYEHRKDISGLAEKHQGDIESGLQYAAERAKGDADISGNSAINLTTGMGRKSVLKDDIEAAAPGIKDFGVSHEGAIESGLKYAAANKEDLPADAELVHENPVQAADDLRKAHMQREAHKLAYVPRRLMDELKIEGAIAGELADHKNMDKKLEGAIEGELADHAKMDTKLEGELASHRNIKALKTLYKRRYGTATNSGKKLYKGPDGDILIDGGTLGTSDPSNLDAPAAPGVGAGYVPAASAPKPTGAVS